MEQAPVAPKKRKHHAPKYRSTGKLNLISRANLDGRTREAEQFDAIATAIAQDLGGSDQLSTVERHLVEAFAGAALSVNDINARLLLGEEIDILKQAQAISTMVRVAQRIGVKRVPTNITPNLRTYEEEAV
jgi:hypothetical protein